RVDEAVSGPESERRRASSGGAHGDGDKLLFHDLKIIAPALALEAGQPPLEAGTQPGEISAGGAGGARLARLFRQPALREALDVEEGGGGAEGVGRGRGGPVRQGGGG